MDLLSRLPLARLNAALVTLSIFLFACGSSSVPALRSFGGPARWAALLALAAAALLWALAERRWPPPLVPAWAAGAFIVLAFASAGWSAHLR